MRRVRSNRSLNGDSHILAAYYRGAHVIIGVFDMNNLDTLKSAERWINEALEITAADNPIVFLVGSKQDLIVKKKKKNDEFPSFD